MVQITLPVRLFCRYVIQVSNQMLDPRTSEFTAAFVGKLVSSLISKVGSALGDNLEHLLRAVLSKMQQAETLSVIQVWIQKDEQNLAHHISGIMNKK